MRIDFPKRYEVILDKHTRSISGLVSVPREYAELVCQKLLEQDWIPWVYLSADSINVRLSTAYEITLEEAYDAICKLIEYVMEPEEEIDTEVWDFSL